MEKEFIPYEQALALKELGFDEECFSYYNYKEVMTFSSCFNKLPIIMSGKKCAIPTFSQAFRWFREKYDCHHTIQHNKKYVGIAYSSVVNFSIDEFNTYEEAELECLKKLIEIVKEM
jgi:hypothetical protein